MLFHDHEFTGLEFTDRIVESCFMNLQGNVLFYGKFNPGIEMSGMAAKLTGIQTESLLGCGDIRDSWPEMYAVINGKKLLSWGSSIDERMLRDLSELYETPFDDDTVFLDLQPLYTRLFGEWSDELGCNKRMSLKAAATKEGVYECKSHTADSDTNMVKEIFDKLLLLSVPDNNNSHQIAEPKKELNISNPFAQFFNQKNN